MDASDLIVKQCLQQCLGQPPSGHGGAKNPITIDSSDDEIVVTKKRKRDSYVIEDDEDDDDIEIKSLHYPKTTSRGLWHNKGTKNLKTIFQRIKTLQNVYMRDYRFPDWNTKQNNFDMVYPKYAKQVRVYHKPHPAMEQNTLEKTVLFREPCNIEMKRYYNLQKMEQNFGWKVGYYGKYYEKYKVLAPNFGIYCVTPIMYKGKLNKFIHLYNAIGYAFDSKKQPDYHYFIVKKNQKDLLRRYQEIFELIIQCARDKKLNTIVMSAVGAFNFASMYKDKQGQGINHFQRVVWVPAFLNALRHVGDINVKFMGIKNSEIEAQLTSNGFSVQDIGYFPDNVTQVNLNKTLFVNAWDPWSLVGNGNFADNSLDGFIGRVSFAAPLCFPPTNPFIKIVN